MKPRQSHDSSGEFPDLLPRDVLCGGELLLFRNPHGEPFGERDAWCLTEEWFALDDIRPAYANLLEKESRLGAKQPFAWNEDFGYLSPFPEHCGTGLLIRADLHLEGLHMIGDIPPVLNALKAVRFGADGVNMDGLQNAAHIFDVYTNASLGISEEDLMAHAERIFSQLVDQEINARLRLVRELPRTFEDAVARSLAILQNCRLLSPWGIGVFLLIVLPWFWSACRANPDFFHFFFIRGGLQRYMTAFRGPYKPLWYCVPVALGAFAP